MHRSRKPSAVGEEPVLIASETEQAADTSGNLLVEARDDIATVPNKAWRKACKRLKILEPLLTEPPALTVAEVAQQHGLGRATVYRWLKLYARAQTVSGLVRQKPGPYKGLRRLTPKVEELVEQCIQTHYLTLQQKRPSQVLREIQLLCYQAGVKAPSAKAVNRRISDVPTEERVRRRRGADVARNLYSSIKGRLTGDDYPHAFVQIDHATADVDLVDETYRMVVGRPFLTLAIDVYSRMVLGFYLSFEHPGAAGTGLCMVHAFLPKHGYLAEKGIAGEWPCQGGIKVLHTDNAREFKGTMLGRACKKYGIRREHRPPRVPHMGGHIERGLRTFLQEMHILPGTTNSNSKAKGHYDSTKYAALTLAEFEKWFVVYLVNVYHNTLHDGIGQVPIARYRRGIADLAERDRPRCAVNELQLRLDFMPAEERVITREGIQIGYIHYNSHILQRFRGPGAHSKEKFLFKKDPRDISHIYFLDPDTNIYHKIPYRNRGYPSMTQHEYVAVRRMLRQQGKADENVPEIMAGLVTMRLLIQDSIAKTKRIRMTKLENRVIQGVPVTETARLMQAGEDDLDAATSPLSDDVPIPECNRAHIRPFD
ncbi:DDE-type integrase/transposase/recombinase [Hymenobacter agri]